MTLNMNQMEYSLRSTEELLASSPCDPEVYKTYISSQAPKPEDTADEIETLQKREISGWSVFHADDNGLFIFNYHVKGFLKEGGRNITGTGKTTKPDPKDPKRTITEGISALVSKIDRFVFVSPRRLYLKRNGKVITKPEGVKERPLRAMTQQGPRVSLKRSDMVLPGAEISFTVSILPLGLKEIKQEHIASWLEYGQLQGLGEWRNAGFGTFELISTNGHGRKAKGAAR